jgi:hypothetical protein
VSSWFLDKKPVGGRISLAIWHYLLLIGLPMPEFDEEREQFPLGYYLGELLAYNVVTFDEAMIIGGVSNSQSVLRIIRCETAFHKPAYTLEELKDEFDARLQAAKAMWVKRLAVTIERMREYIASEARTIDTGKVTQTTPKAARARSPKPLDLDEVVREVISRLGLTPDKLSALLALQVQPGARELPTPEDASGAEATTLYEIATLFSAALVATNHMLHEASPEERARLRVLMGERNMALLKHNVTRLCSERINGRHDDGKEAE